MGTSIEYDLSTRACCKALDIELVDIADWSCCGSTPAHTVDHTLSAALAARNLALVEEMGYKSVITPCPSCLTALRTANHRMENESFREKANALLDSPFEGEIEAKSVLQVILEDFGPDKIAERVKNPLKGLVVAPYYGCIMNRPPELMAFDDPENPIAMDRIVEALGAEVAPFPFKVECCGAAHGVPKKDVVMFLSSRILSMVEESGANAVVVACPLCHQNLDLRQGQINAARKTLFNIPVFYFTQLIGLALGIKEKELGLNKHNVSPKGLLKEMAEVPAEVAK
jgi:heterodisulfide reductase subunit B